LNLYFLTSWIGGKGLLEFFESMAAMMDSSKRTDTAIEARYQFLAWVVPTMREISQEPQVHDRRPYRNHHARLPLMML
jgi:hypothetical protein